ncbi:aspartate/glutamate racemase family protein [Virgibacillus sp. CBA3643]|uniref:aspartate/glutamate racemase family protein n=1 Tax=Virgibacillus sp. CBA3643 TaxID=2942278 RepID=UPI0035A37675
MIEQKEQSFLEAVAKDLATFDYAGVCNIAIPCNTSHYFMKKLQAMTDINIINMVDETAKYIRERYGESAKVAILATDGTVNTGIYQKSLANYNLLPYIPNGNEGCSCVVLGCTELLALILAAK